MKKTTLYVGLAAVAGLALSLSLSARAAAAEPTVLQVIVVQTTDLDAYVREVNNLQSLYRKAGLSITLRVWRATYAGADAGAIVVAVEAPNLAALAKLSALDKSNSEIGAEMQRIYALRRIVSDSLYEELIP